MHATRSRVLQVFGQRLMRLPVARHPALFFNPWAEGYRNYAFGGAAGPSVHASNMFHELAHAAQLGPDMFRTRATDTGFHFKVPQRFIFDRYCCEPKTGQATHRELQTFAYQLHLMRAAGYKIDDDRFMADSAKLMRFMHDWYHIHGDDDEGRAHWCREQIATHYAGSRCSEVVDRLEGWLDATQRRLDRIAKSDADRAAALARGKKWQAVALAH